MPPRNKDKDFDVVNSLHDSENPDAYVEELDNILLDEDFDDIQTETNWRDFLFPVEED